MALTSICAVIGALLIYVVWKVTVPGLTEINVYLPVLAGIVGFIIAASLMAGVCGIVAALLGMPIIKLIYFGAWKAINILFPFAVFLGRAFNFRAIK